MSGSIVSIDLLSSCFFFCIWVGATPYLNEDMPKNSGNTQAAIQKVASPDLSAGVVTLRVESQATVPTKPRTIRPHKIVIKTI